MSLTRREFQRLVCLVESHGWRVEFSQTKGNSRQKRVRLGSHAHALAYPPHPDASPVPMSISGDPMARQNVWAGLRRNGLEPDPRRQQQRAAKKRRRK